MVTYLMWQVPGSSELLDKDEVSIQSADLGTDISNGDSSLFEANRPLEYLNSGGIECISTEAKGSAVNIGIDDANCFSGACLEDGVRNKDTDASAEYLVDNIGSEHIDSFW